MVADDRDRAVGLAARLPPQVAAGLDALSRVARALNGTEALAGVASGALAEMRDALDLDIAALYLPDDEGRRLLRRYLACGRPPGEPAVRGRLDLDPEAWRLAVESGHPLVFREPAGWLVANPFDPPASHWLVLPLLPAGQLAGVVVAAKAVPIELDPVTATVLSLLGEQLSTGIATARLRQQLQHAELASERTRLAAEVHDGLAQDLALAVRELALLRSRPPAGEAEASLTRLHAAVSSAHELVRARLADLATPLPLGGVRTAVGELCDRFARRGLAVTATTPQDDVDVPPEAVAVVVRVLEEALANAHRHSGASLVRVDLALANRSLSVTVEDDGCGFDPHTAGGPHSGHLGLTLMRKRAREAHGELEMSSEPGGGTMVALRIPLEDATRGGP